jgi:putative nucleotidyltransferase with HDIG domain
MAIDPSFQEQQVLAESLLREESRMTPRERAAEAVVGGGFVIAAVGLWVAWPPGTFAVGPAVICVAVLALATKVRLDTPLGFTVATQLAFVPLLFALPVTLVPVAVVIGLAFAQLQGVRDGRPDVRALWLVVGNSWFAIGPVAVFTIAHTEPAHASAWLLLAALVAQFVVDFGVSTLRFWIRRGATIAAQLRETWVYAVDAALSPVGLLAALAIHDRSLAALALVPLIGLLTMFARERQRRLRGLLELNRAYRGTALVLGDVVEADDGYTGHHSRSVVGLALAVADTLDLSPEERRNLEFAALLHDVGKIAIPKELINKPGPLDSDEWLIIKTHTIEGQKMLDRIGGFLRDVGRIVRAHHERWDGSGYPDGQSGEEIPLEARIIACCDTWNAMRTDRAYRRALSYEAALAELRAAAGTQLDPKLVATLLSLVTSPTAAAAERAMRP